MAITGHRSKWRKFVVIFMFLYITACVLMLFYTLKGTANSEDVFRDVTQTLRVTSKAVRTTGSIGAIRNTTSASCTCYSTRMFPSTLDNVRNTPTVLCPEIPPNLVGRLNLTSDVRLGHVTQSECTRRLLPGGHYTPRDCISLETVAVIIPYRDRARHLSILVHHLHAVLQRQQLKYAIFVVEMAYPSQFNRGLLANVGFLTALNDETNYTCYVIHDVDLLPADDRNLYRCGRHPRHLSISSSKFGYKLPYEHYIGGVVAFTPQQYIRVNGFSNFYFGWGKEDDDLYQRIVQSRYIPERPDPEVGVYQELPHLRDPTNQDNPMKDGLLTFSSRRWRNDGVNHVLYSRLSLEYRPLYTWLLVNTSEASIMKQMNFFIPARVKLPRNPPP